MVWIFFIFANRDLEISCDEAVIKKFTSETGNERFAFFKEGMFNAITGQNNGED